MSESIEYSGEVTVRFTCGECGQALDTGQATDRYGDVTVNVCPCVACVEKARDEGREEAEDE